MNGIIFLSLLLISFVIMLSTNAQNEPCPNARVTLVETVPKDLQLPKPESTFASWLRILSKANSTIDIACYYMTLTQGSEYPDVEGSWMGPEIYKQFEIINKQKNVTIRIVQNEPSQGLPDTDTANLQRLGIAEVRTINWNKLLTGGILHTKLLIVDKKHMYVGSANFDWRALSEIKELGIVVEDCELLVNDASKIFEQYWESAKFNILPPQWPQSLDASYTVEHPLTLPLNGQLMKTFFSASPPKFCSNRTTDLQALLDKINKAKSVCVSVMDYSPTTLYLPKNYYWSYLDDAFRNASFNNKAPVKLLFSLWNHTSYSSFQYMRSLDALDGIEVKLFHIPELNPPVPFTRVSHSKYMVTDTSLFITTSNWSGDYFIDTGGVSFNAEFEALRLQLQSIFDADWNSEYAIPIKNFNTNIYKTQGVE